MQNIDRFYPVGTIYETLDSSFNPNITWGGIWEKIEGKFLLGSSSSYSVGSTGGAITHEHELTKAVAAINFITGDNLYGEQRSSSSSFTMNRAAVLNYCASGSWGQATNGVAIKNNTDSTSNLPPYQAVNIWKRTA